MLNDINKLAESLGLGDLEKLGQKLKNIKKLLILSLLADESLDLQTISGESPSEDETLAELKNIATTKTEDSTTFYLLHRPTEDFEYNSSTEGSETNQYETDSNTVWFAEYIGSQNNQVGKNPVVSCWIPESAISTDRNSLDNTGTWGDLGENPYADIFQVSVKPGKYTIYQEYRQKR